MRFGVLCSFLLAVTAHGAGFGIAPLLQRSDMTNITLSLSGNGNTLFVDPIYGNDSTAQRGSEARPWLTFSNALAQVQNGDTVIVRSGTHTNNTFTVPAVNTFGMGPLQLNNKTNVSIWGNGANTRIVSTVTNECDFFCISNCSNLRFIGLSFEGTR